MHHLKRLNFGNKMRYYNYLNENVMDDGRNRILHKKCSYYLSLIKNNMIFTRALSHPEDSIFYLKTARTNRKPKGGTDPINYKRLNNFLKMNGHIPRDIAVIATSREHSAITGFGKNHYIFPVGRFNYTYIKSRDFNMDDDRNGYYYEMFIDFFKGRDSSFPDYFVSNKDLYEAYRRQYEIWFDCKEYYVASIEDYNWNKKEQKLERK